MQQANAFLERQEKREALLEPTTALLAHEIKNPLGSMKLFLSLLEHDLHSVQALLPQDTLTLLAHIKESIASIDDVLTNALNFLVQERLRIGIVNIQSLIEGQLEMIRPRCHGISVQSTIRGNPFLYADERALSHALFNLLINAQEALECRGSITVDCDAKSEESIVITVSDDGPGIPEDLAEVLFLPHVTTKKSGSGFGLALVKRIIENHSGEIVCESGEGTRMIMRIPRGVLQSNHYNRQKGRE